VTYSALSASAQDAPDFVDNIAPILTKHCMECHNSREASGGLTLEHRDGLLRGSIMLKLPCRWIVRVNL
jgi:hypothetical protein